MKNREFISFADFLAQKQINESAKTSNTNEPLNEGIIDTIKNVIKKVKDFFTGKGSHFLNLLVLQQKKDLPGRVKVIPNAVDLEALAALDSKVTKSSIPVLKVDESLSYTDTIKFINEAQVPLHYDKATDIELPMLKKKVALSIKTKKPILLWGAPGIGKTSIVNAVNKDFSGRLIDVPLSTMMPENFFLPAAKSQDFSDPKNRVAIDLPVEWLPVYHKSEGEEGNKRVNGIDGKGGVLFLDELTRANKGVLNNCLKLILERRVGDYLLGDEWSIICAANRDFDDPNSEINVDLSALDNRVKHYNYVPRVEDWAAWAQSEMRKKGPNSEELELLIDPAIPLFLRFSEKYFHYLDTDDYKHAWPSPRSWAEAGQELIELRKEAAEEGRRLSGEDVRTTMEATVGREATTEFMGFLKIMEEIDLKEIEEVWSNGKKASLPPIKKAAKDYTPDIAYAYLGAVIFKRNGVKLSKSEIENFLDWIIRVGQGVDNGNKWSMLGIKLLTSSHAELSPKGADKELAEYFAKKYNDVVDAFPSLFKK